jgi:hypothetical protein
VTKQHDPGDYGVPDNLVDLIETRAVNAVPIIDRFDRVPGKAVDGVVSVANRVSWLGDDTINAMPAAGF